VAAGAWVAVEAVLVTGLVTELRMDPTAPVTGSVTAWTVPETVDVSPESNDGGWPTVAACACAAGNDKTKQTPPVVIATCVTRRMTRRVFGFGIDNSKSPGNSRVPHGCPEVVLGRARCSVTTVQSRRKANKAR
jgi:hypothetical protein